MVLSGWHAARGSTERERTHLPPTSSRPFAGLLHAATMRNEAMGQSVFTACQWTPRMYEIRLDIRRHDSHRRVESKKAQGTGGGSAQRLAFPTCQITRSIVDVGPNTGGSGTSDASRRFGGVVAERARSELTFSQRPGRGRSSPGASPRQIQFVFPMLDKIGGLYWRYWQNVSNRTSEPSK